MKYCIFVEQYCNVNLKYLVMAWLAKDANGAEFIYDEQPTRKLDHYRNNGDCVELPKGGILALLGRELTFVEGGVELLETSAPITEDMVKDLPFINVDHDENGEVTSAICNAITDRYDVTKYAKGWAVRIDSTSKYTACDDLAHGIALCNQHHKKIILSQLK